MSALDAFFVGGFALIMLGAAVRIWRGEVPGLGDEPAAWPWGSIAWRAYVRCLPSVVVGGVAFLVLAGVLAIAPERPDGPFARPMIWIVPALAALALSVLVVLCVAVFNRPKCLVSRGLRQEPGAAAELLARRRRRRSSMMS